jgi:glycosyltransferase involved in cell wall biosynthesis
MTPPLVSCVIPLFNGERYIGQTLDSVFAQTHRPIEVIVVDDGSTDGSAAIVQKYGEGLTLIAQANAGHAAARNAGIAVATGEYIAFLDADDLWSERKLELQLERFAARPELGIVFTFLQNFWSPDADPAGRPPDQALLPVPGYTSVSMLARRAAFDLVGPLDVTLKHCNDRDWFCRAAEQHVTMDMIAEPLVRRRLHGSNRSAALGGDSRAEYLRILKASLDRRRGDGTDVAAYPFHAAKRDATR